MWVSELVNSNGWTYENLHRARLGAAGVMLHGLVFPQLEVTWVPKVRFLSCWSAAMLTNRRWFRSSFSLRCEGSETRVVKLRYFTGNQVLNNVVTKLDDQLQVLFLQPGERQGVVLVVLVPQPDVVVGLQADPVAVELDYCFG